MQYKLLVHICCFLMLSCTFLYTKRSKKLENIRNISIVFIHIISSSRLDHNFGNKYAWYNLTFLICHQQLSNGLCCWSIDITIVLYTVCSANLINSQHLLKIISFTNIRRFSPGPSKLYSKIAHHKMSWDGIRKRTISLGFLGIISRVLTWAFYLSFLPFYNVLFMNKLNWLIVLYNFWNHRGTMVFCQVFLLCLHQ
jgi:hypothetical protein